MSDVFVRVVRVAGVSHGHAPDSPLAQQQGGPQAATPLPLLVRIGMRAHPSASAHIVERTAAVDGEHEEWNEVLHINTRDFSAQSASLRLELCCETGASSPGAAEEREASSPPLALGGCDVTLRWLSAQGAVQHRWLRLQTASGGECGRVLVSFSNSRPAGGEGDGSPDDGSGTVPSAMQPQPVATPAAREAMLVLSPGRLELPDSALSALPTDDARFMLELSAGTQVAWSSAVGRDSLMWSEVLKLSVPDADLALASIRLYCLRGSSVGGGVGGDDGDEGDDSGRNGSSSGAGGVPAAAAAATAGAGAKDGAHRAIAAKAARWQRELLGECVLPLMELSQCAGDHSGEHQVLDMYNTRTGHAHAASLLGTGSASPSRRHCAAQLHASVGLRSAYDPRGAPTRQLPRLPEAGDLWVQVLTVVGCQDALREPCVRIKLLPSALLARTASATCNDGPGHAIEFGGAAEQFRYSDVYLERCRKEQDELRARTRRKRSEAAAAKEGQPPVSSSEWQVPALRLELVAKGRRTVGRAELCLLSTLCRSPATLVHSLPLLGDGLDQNAQVSVRLQFTDHSTGPVVSPTHSPILTPPLRRGIVMLKLLALRGHKGFQQACYVVRSSARTTGALATTRALDCATQETYVRVREADGPGIPCAEEMWLETADAACELLELEIFNKAALTSPECQPLGRAFLSCGDLDSGKPVWVRVFAPYQPLHGHAGPKRDVELANSAPSCLCELLLKPQFNAQVFCADIARVASAMTAQAVASAERTPALPPVMLTSLKTLGSGWAHIRDVGLHGTWDADQQQFDGCDVGLLFQLGSWSQTSRVKQVGDATYMWSDDTISVPVDWSLGEQWLPVLRATVIDLRGDNAQPLPGSPSFAFNLAPLCLQAGQVADLRLEATKGGDSDRLGSMMSNGCALQLQCCYTASQGIARSASLPSEPDLQHAMDVGIANTRGIAMIDGELDVHLMGLRKMSQSRGMGSGKQVRVHAKLTGGGMEAESRKYHQTGHEVQCDEHLSLAFGGGQRALAVELSVAHISEGKADTQQQIGVIHLPILAHVVDGHVCDTWWPILSKRGSKCGEIRVALHLASSREQDASAPQNSSQMTAANADAHDHLLFATIERAQSVGSTNQLGQMDLVAQVELVNEAGVRLSAASTRPSLLRGRNPKWNETVSVPLPLDVLLGGDDTGIEDEDTTSTKILAVRVTLNDINRVRDGGVVGVAHVPLSAAVMFQHQPLQGWFKLVGGHGNEAFGKVFLSLCRGKHAQSNMLQSSSLSDLDEAAPANDASLRDPAHAGLLYVRATDFHGPKTAFEQCHLVTAQLVDGDDVCAERLVEIESSRDGAMWDGPLILPVPGEQHDLTFRVIFSIGETEDETIEFSAPLDSCHCMKLPMQPWKHSFACESAHVQHAPDEDVELELTFVPPRRGKLHVTVQRATNLRTGSSTQVKSIDAFVKVKFMPSGEFHHTKVSERARSSAFWGQNMQFSYCNASEREEPSLFFEVVNDRAVAHNVVSHCHVPALPYLLGDSNLETVTLKTDSQLPDRGESELTVSFRFVPEGHMGDDIVEQTSTAGKSAVRSALTSADIKRLFYRLDTDGNGWVSKEEMRTALASKGPDERLSLQLLLGGGRATQETVNETLTRVFALMDKNQDQYVQWGEFLAFLQQNVEKEATSASAGSPKKRPRSPRKLGSASSNPSAGPAGLSSASNGKVRKLQQTLGRSQSEVARLTRQLALQSHVADEAARKQSRNAENYASSGDAGKHATGGRTRARSTRQPLKSIQDAREHLAATGAIPDRETLEHDLSLLRARVSELEGECRRLRTERMQGETRVTRRYRGQMLAMLEASKEQSVRGLSSSMPAASEAGMDERVLDLEHINKELKQQLRKANIDLKQLARATKDSHAKAANVIESDRDTPGEVALSEPVTGENVKQRDAEVLRLRSELTQHKLELDDVLAHCRWLQGRAGEKRGKAKEAKQALLKAQRELEVTRQQNVVLQRDRDELLTRVREFERRFHVNRNKQMKLSQDLDALNDELDFVGNGRKIVTGEQQARKAERAQKDTAAVGLQARVRGRGVRRNNAATKLQPVARGHLGRREARRRRDAIMLITARCVFAYARLKVRRLRRHHKAAVTLQARARGNRSRTSLETRRKAVEEQRFRIDEEQVEREEAVNSIVAIVRTFIARQRYLRVLKLEDDKAWELAVREENAAHRLGLWGRGWLDRHGGARNATKGKKESVLVEEVATKDETASTLTNKAVETPAQSHGGAKSVEADESVPDEHGQAATLLQAQWRRKQEDIKFRQRFNDLTQDMPVQTRQHLLQDFESRSAANQLHFLHELEKTLEQHGHEEIERHITDDIFWQHIWETATAVPESLHHQIDTLCRPAPLEHRREFVRMLEGMPAADKMVATVSALSEMPALVELGGPKFWLLAQGVPPTEDVRQHVQDCLHVALQSGMSHDDCLQFVESIVSAEEDDVGAAVPIIEAFRDRARAAAEAAISQEAEDAAAASADAAAAGSAAAAAKVEC